MQVHYRNLTKHILQVSASQYLVLVEYVQGEDSRSKVRDVNQEGVAID